MRECPTCKRSVRHGGKCYEENSSKPCLIYDKDPRGKQVYIENSKLDLEFGTDIPMIGKSDDGWQVDGVSKTITVNKIRRVEWNSNKRGLRGIYVWVDYVYWSDENGIITDKPKLSLCK